MGALSPPAAGAAAAPSAAGAPGSPGAACTRATAAGRALAAGDELPLLRRHPGLRALPRARFVSVPTPVEPLALPGAAAGACFVKRDERCCPLYGGNKPRKLEFLIGAAEARGSRRLVTTGGIGTHHGLATTILGRSRGLATTVVTVPQPIDDHVREQLRALVAWGADVRFARGVAGAAARTAGALLAAAARGERPTLVPTGGSSALGDVGFVSAAFELAEQVEAGVLPAPREIYVPLGSGGTLAGLLLGTRLAGLDTRLVGVLVTDLLPPTPGRILAQARATAARLRRLAPELPEVALSKADFELTRAQLGAGYGAATAAGAEAAAVCAALGLRLDPVYTAKCMAEVIARLREGRARPPLLFWNTFNDVDVWARAPGPGDPAALPAALRRRLAEAAR